MNINYLTINQKGFVFYLAVVKANEIVQFINVNRRTNADSSEYKYDLFDLEKNIQDINEYKLGKGLQRELNTKKSESIKDYIKSEFGMIPNSIVINIDDPLGLVEFNNRLIIPEDDSINITAIDGQHRIEGIKKYISENPTENYELPFTILYNADLQIQAHIFGTINSTQTGINKSFLYDLLSLSRNSVTEFKLCHEIAYWLNSSEESVLKNDFKMLGKGNGWLSQAAFIDYLLPYVYTSNKSKENNGVIFKSLYKQKKYKEIALFINEYFKSIFNVFKEFKDDEYIFKTSFTFGIFMKLMPYAYVYSVNKKNSLDKFMSLVRDVNIDFLKNGPNAGTGSSGKQNKIFNTIIEDLDKKTDIRGQVSSFKGSNI